MHKYLTVVLLAALSATLVPAAAEESGGREAELEQRYAEVRERLELTDEQAEASRGLCIRVIQMLVKLTK